jgi:ABC-2 type transport system permease protein
MTPATVATSTGLSAQQFRTIAWLRWRIFVNSMRFKGAVGELVAKIISYPFLALLVFAPAVGAAFASYYLVHKGMDAYLAIPLWILFFLWQFVGASTSATGPSFDLSTLTRFPLRYRDYLLMRLSFGLMDPPTLAGITCLIAMTLGVALAAPAMLPWAGFAFLAYCLCLILFSRMVYSWTERWLARRKTRELLTGAILLGSLAFQFSAQFIQKLSRVGDGPMNPIMLKTAKALVAINWFLPPGLTASSIEHMHHGAAWIAVAAMLALLAYAAGFLAILHLRLHAEYMGESLSEAPAAIAAKARVRKTRSAEATTATATGSSSLLSPAVAANLVREIRYLLRSGPKLYVLIMPVFVVVLFSMRNSGFEAVGMRRNAFATFLFSYGCAYMQLIFVGLLYNAFGSDGGGVQFYFIAPVRFRDVMLAKNLLIMGIFAIEIVLIYVASAFLGRPCPPDLTVATLAWCAFTLLLNMSIGNIRSIVSPKAMDPAKVRSQNVSGLNSLISIVVVVVAASLGSLMVMACRYLGASYWLAAGTFGVLAALAAVLYALVMRNMDGIAEKNAENLTRVLSKVG